MSEVWVWWLGHRTMEEDSYRFIIVATQYIWWVLAQFLRLRYDIQAHRPAGLFEQTREHCLILASSHRSVLDPWLIMVGLKYRHFRTLIPVRILATQTFVGKLSWLNWFKPLVKLVYRMAGVIVLQPENKGDGFHPEKIRGLAKEISRTDSAHCGLEEPTALAASGVRGQVWSTCAES